MIRIPNPKSDPISLREVFRVIVELFEAANWPSEGLGHDDLGQVAAEHGLVSSKGQIGQAALERSFQANRSLDAVFNQMKMLTELYRILGWLMPIPESRGRFLVTPLGLQVAQFRGASFDRIVTPAGSIDERILIEHCLLNICFPHPHTDANPGHNQRTFLLILKVAAASGGYITRDELIATALNIADDRVAGSTGITECVNKLNAWRSGQSTSSFVTVLDGVSEKLGIKLSTLTNYTRFPVGVMRAVGWVRLLKFKSLPPHVQQAYQRELGEKRAGKVVVEWLTERGRYVVSEAAEKVDVRWADFDEASDEELAHMVVLLRAASKHLPEKAVEGRIWELGTKALDRVGAGVSVKNGLLHPPAILFEPFQQLPSRVLLAALELAHEAMSHDD